MSEYADEVRDRAIAYVLDASALLALLQGETAAEWLDEVLGNSIISTVNWCEVLTKSLEHGADLRDAGDLLQAEGVQIIPFTANDAARAATLREPTRSLGLSLGDLACLALSRAWGIPALTADRVWKQLDEELGIEVQLIR